MTTETEQALEALRLTEKVKPGPWLTAASVNNGKVYVTAKGQRSGSLALCDSEATAFFIAFARTALPSLAQAVLALSEENERLAERVKKLEGLVRCFLNCPEIADCAPDDKDPETIDLEHDARALLSAPTEGE